MDKSPQPLKRPPHRWDRAAATTAGRKGGSSPKRPKGLGKRRKRD